MSIWKNKWYEDYETTVFCLLGEPDEEQQRAVAELNKILQKMGGAIEFKEIDSGEKPIHFLALKLSPEAAADHDRRGAGRKKKILQAGVMRVGAVRKMMLEKSADDVAAELRISRSTLFRRLKDRDDDEFF